MTKDNNTSLNNEVNQHNNYPNNYYNDEQNNDEFYKNNNQYYNNYSTQDTNLNNYNDQYYNYNQNYNNQVHTNQNYNNFNDETNFNTNSNQYLDYNNSYYGNYNQGQDYDFNQNYSDYPQNNQNFAYDENSYNQYYNDYNQNSPLNSYSNGNFNQKIFQHDYTVQNNDEIFIENQQFTPQSDNQSKISEAKNLNNFNSATEQNYNQQFEKNTFYKQQNNTKEFINDKNIVTEQLINKDLDNEIQSEQNIGQNNDKGNFETIPPVPPIINNKQEDNLPPKKGQNSKKKLVTVISTLLGIVLLVGGYYHYYSKKENTKVVDENEVYASIIQKYKTAIINPDNSDKEINYEALKAALKEKKNDDYIKYVFYDIDGNGRKELLIARNDKPNNPIDIYTFDKNNKVIRLFNPETIDRAILNKLGIDGSNNNSGSAVFKDKTIRIRKFDKDTGEYNFLKFSEDGNKLEKTNVITFTGLDVDNSKYKDITTGKEYDSKNSFNSSFPLPEVLKFDGENWKSVKNFGEKTEGNNNENNTANNQREKTDNYETAYISILKDYKDAINKGKSDKKDINPVAISNYKVFGEKQVGKNFLNYGFFDINGDGKDELLLFTEASKDKPNEYSPMDVYTLDKNNKVVRITPEFVNGERTTLSITKDKAFHVYGSGGAKVHGYTFYRLINDGTTLEKTDDFSFDAEVNPKEYERHYPVDKVENIPVDQFKEKVINKNNYIKFDFSKRKSIFDFKA